MPRPLRSSCSSLSLPLSYLPSLLLCPLLHFVAVIKRQRAATCGSSSISAVCCVGARYALILLTCGHAYFGVFFPSLPTFPFGCCCCCCTFRLVQDFHSNCILIAATAASCNLMAVSLSLFLSLSPFPFSPLIVQLCFPNCLLQLSYHMCSFILLLFREKD